MKIRQKRIKERRTLLPPNGFIDIELSVHAQERAAQRCLSNADILYILRHGRRYHAADVIFYFLVGRDLPKSDRREMSRLIGTAVIASKDRSTIVTLWRNRQNGMRNIRRKLAASR